MFMPYKTECVFHQQQQITHFCKCQSCLLPLCPQCIPVHKIQHKNIPQPINLHPVREQLEQISTQIKDQLKKLQYFEQKTIKNYEQSQKQHRQLKQYLRGYCDHLVELVTNTFYNMINQIQKNCIKRNQWLKRMHKQIQNIKLQYKSIQDSLWQQKYLRTVIMWHRIKPFKQMDQVLQKVQRKWLIPFFENIPCNQMINSIKSKMKLHMLEIDNWFGIDDVLHNIKKIRQSNISQSMHRNNDSPYKSNRSKIKPNSVRPYKKQFIRVQNSTSIRKL